MFAVPGWAVSADSLKSETNKASAPPAAGQNEPSSNDSKSKKRKRPSMPSNVTSANVADLWERVIEGKSGKKPKTEKKKQKQIGHVKEQQSVVTQVKDDEQQPGDDDAPRNEKKKAKKEKKKLKDGGHVEPSQGEEEEGSAKKSKKDKKKNKQQQVSESQGDDGEAQPEDGHNNQAKSPTTTVVATAAAAPPAPKLTPLQAAMREKLISARFRHLNETLYTRPSAEAFQLFEDSPEMFQEYHEGFRRQVDVWPENPVDGYIAEIQLRGRQKTPTTTTTTTTSSKHHHHHHHHQQQKPSDTEDVAPPPPPLPRTGGTCTIADLGCGDAKLGAALAPSRRKLRLEVHSYDLHSTGPRVTRADVADLPRADGSVDVAVFCLALMGTNWLDFVEEAYRVLRWKGELWVAEIKSRFSAGGGGGGGRKNGNGNGNGVGVVSHSVGNRRKPGATPATTAGGGGGGGGGGKKGGGRKNGTGDDDDDAGAAAAADHETDLAVEVDGAEDRRGETDVSGFVRALQRRGFVLQGEPDLRNRMFVRMRFVKAASATVGKCAVPAVGGGGGGGGGSAAAATAKDRHDRHDRHDRRPLSLTQKRDALKKFLDVGSEEEQAKADERGILKPCVYKIR